MSVAAATAVFGTMSLTAYIHSAFACFDATGQLLVNFDKAMMQLIRETKHLQRMDIDVPESARQVLNQEEKFKVYFNQLTYALKVWFPQSILVPMFADVHSASRAHSHPTDQADV